MKIVIKVGTSTLAHATGRLNIRRVEHLVKVLWTSTDPGIFRRHRHGRGET